MKTRIITALVLIPILVLILISGNWVIAAAVTVVSTVGLYELYKATGVLEKKPLAVLGFVSGVCVALRLFIPNDWYMGLVFLAIIIMFVIMLKCHKTISVEDAAMTVFGVIYVPFLLSMLTAVAQLESGSFLLWVVVIGAFATDTFAYFTGVFLGKHKLCPEISPKKTIEGSIGGTVGCMLLILAYGLLLEKQFGQEINYIKLGVLGILIAVVSQIGDLTASIIKRRYGVKDYGNIFPGHGGVLDRLDSVIATAPLVYVYIMTVGL